jgi:hypothetical protein
VETAADLPARDREIAQLVEALGHEQRARREQAYKRLLQLGPRVLWYLPFAGQDTNQERGRLTRELIVAIQAKYGIQSIRHKGFEFRPFADLVWRLPPPGEERAVSLGVNITNIGDKTARFYLPDTIMPHLVDSEARPVAESGGAYHCFIRDQWSPALTPGAMHTVSGFRAKLVRSEDGKELSLEGETETGYFFAFRNLKPGRYFLSFACNCTYDSPKALEDGERKMAYVRAGVAYQGCEQIGFDHITTMLVAVEIK